MNENNSSQQISPRTYQSITNISNTIYSQQFENSKIEIRNERRDEIQQLRNEMIQIVNERIGRIERPLELLTQRIPEDFNPNDIHQLNNQMQTVTQSI